MPFTEGSETYRSDLQLGERYQDNTTGVDGTLTAIHFYQHACERGTIRFVNKQGDVVEASFDAPELVHVVTRVAAMSSRPSGPVRAEGRRS